MSELHEYIRAHSVRHPAGTVAGATNVVFFDVRAKESADADHLRALLAAHEEGFMELNLFDGGEYGYIELGAWLGSQGDALALIGLGTQLGLWRLLSPRTMLGEEVPTLLETRLAEKGLVSVQATPNSATAPV
jgi:hypothetical protein